MPSYPTASSIPISAYPGYPTNPYPSPTSTIQSYSGSAFDSFPDFPPTLPPQYVAPLVMCHPHPPPLAPPAQSFPGCHPQPQTTQGAVYPVTYDPLAAPTNIAAPAAFPPPEVIASGVSLKKAHAPKKNAEPKSKSGTSASSKNKKRLVISGSTAPHPPVKLRNLPVPWHDNPSVAPFFVPIPTPPLLAPPSASSDTIMLPPPPPHVLPAPIPTLATNLPSTAVGEPQPPPASLPTGALKLEATFRPLPAPKPKVSNTTLRAPLRPRSVVDLKAPSVLKRRGPQPSPKLDRLAYIAPSSEDADMIDLPIPSMSILLDHQPPALSYSAAQTRNVGPTAKSPPPIDWSTRPRKGTFGQRLSLAPAPSPTEVGSPMDQEPDENVPPPNGYGYRPLNVHTAAQGLPQASWVPQRSFSMPQLSIAAPTSAQYQQSPVQVWPSSATSTRMPLTPASATSQSNAFSSLTAIDPAPAPLWSQSHAAFLEDLDMGGVEALLNQSSLGGHPACLPTQPKQDNVSTRPWHLHGAWYQSPPPTASPGPYA